MLERIALKERRRLRRERMIGTGLIAYAGGHYSMDCVVLDWSECGARIRPADMIECPNHFALVTKTGLEVPCQVIWRRDEVVGVRFV